MTIALIEHRASGLLFEFRRKRTTLLGHQDPLYGEHSRAKWVSGAGRSLLSFFLMILHDFLL